MRSIYAKMLGEDAVPAKKAKAAKTKDQRKAEVAARVDKIAEKIKAKLGTDPNVEKMGLGADDVVDFIAEVVKDLANIGIDVAEAIKTAKAKLKELGVDEDLIKEAEAKYEEQTTPKEETVVQKVRSLYRRFAKDESKPKELREAIAQADKYYQESSNKFTSQMADAMIEVAKEAGEVDALWAEASDIDFAALDDQQAAVKGMMMSKIANYYEVTGQMQKAAEAYGKMFRTATNAGKFIQTLANQTHPEAIIARAKATLVINKDKALKKENPATGKTNKETISDIHDIAKEGTKEANSKIGESKKIGEAAKKTAEKKTKRERSEAYRQKVKSDLKKAVTALNEALGININLDDDVQAQGLTMGNLINLIAEAAVAAKTATETIEEAISRVVDVLKKKGLLPKNFNEEQIKKSSYDRIQRNQFNADKKKTKEARKFIKETLAEEYDINLKKIVEDFYEDANLFKGSLVDRLMADGGLDINEAKEFAKVVEAEYDKLLDETKKRIAERINNIIPPDASTLAAKANKRLQQKINKALLLGRVQINDFSDLFGEALGFVVLTPEMEQKISDLKDGLKIFPEGSKEYYKRLQDFNTYLDKIRVSQFPPWKRTLTHIGRVLKELFYNNLLSGVTTFYTNVRGILHTGSTLTGVTAMVKGGKNGDGTRLYIEGLKSLAKGLKQGVPEFKQIIADGFNSQYASEEAKQPISPLRALMAKPMNEAAWYELPAKTFMYLPIKMVRAFIATDALAKNGLREYYATIKSYDDMILAGQKSSAKDFWANVHNMAKNTKENFQVFKEQAAIEEAGYKARGIKTDKNFIGIRAAELAQQERSDDIAAYAELMAQRSTLNNKPEGTLGVVYEIMNQAQQKIPALYTQIPFIKIAINMIDTWLEWSPYAFKRAIFGRGIGFEGNQKNWNKYRIGKNGGEDWIEDRALHVIRGSVGTVALAYLGAALADLLDDDDKQSAWNIFSNVTANLSNDPALAYEYKQQGLKPYTVYFSWGGELSYKESVLAPMFAWLGYSLDEKRDLDNKLNLEGLKPKDNKTGNQLMVDNFVNSIFFIKEQSFIQPFSEMLELGGRMQSNENAKNKLVKSGINTTKSTLYPKFYESIFKGYKTFNQMPEMRPSEASDGLDAALAEQFAKNIPYFDDKIQNKYYDRLGNEMTSKYYNTFPVPLFQQSAVEGMRSMIGVNNETYENWGVVDDLNISVNYNIPTTDANGNKLNTEQRTKLSKAVGEFASKRLMEEKGKMKKLEPEERQRVFNDFIQEAFKKYKELYFGTKDIVPPTVISNTEIGIKSRTKMEIGKIKEDK
jgi:hypothetical protein